MKSLATMRIIREPDMALSVNAEDKAIGVWSEDKNASKESDHPLAQVLKPSQIKQFDLTEWPYAQDKFDPIYNSIHDSLKILVEKKDLNAVLVATTELMAKMPTITCGVNKELEQKCYNFFVHSPTNISSDRIGNFLQSTQGLGLEQYLKNIGQRIDALKSEVLIKTVMGTLGEEKKNALAKLKAEIGLVALVSEKKANARRKNISFGFTKHIMDAQFLLPAFAFKTNACKNSPDIPNVAESPLAIKAKKQEAAAKSKISPKTEDDAEDSNAEKCKCDCGNPACKPVDNCCVDIHYYMTDLLELREETHCYKASDLAYIENIAPHELRVRKHTFRKEIEDYTEEETTESRSEQYDHSRTDRSSVQKQIEKQISTNLDVDAKVTGKTANGTYTVDSSASLSRDTSQREAREKFREMVTKSVQKIQTENRKLKTTRVTTESTETNEHTFDNKENAEHQIAKYFYVSQEKKAQVFSHGQRLMLDILIPSPAANYLALEEKKAKTDSGLEVPKRPDLVPSDIAPNQSDKFPKWEEENKTYRSLWEHIMQEFEITDLPEPPPDEKPSRGAIPITNMAPGGRKIVSIPLGYKAVEMFVDSGSVSGPRASSRVGLGVFDRAAYLRKDGKKETNPIPVNVNGPKEITIAGIAQRYGKGTVNGHITLTPIKYDYSNWQEEVHAAIMSKFEADLAEYNRKLAEHNMSFKEERKLMPPFAAEEHMRTQIKQAAIFMMCDDIDDNVMNMKTEPCGYPTFYRKASHEATKRWYFFDRAFDWNLSEFIFFDYFRNPICKWEDTFDPDEPNFLFKAFKRAGYARLQLPVAPGMEGDVLAYLKDGTFWNGDGLPSGDEGDERFMSVVAELKHSKGCQQNDREGTVEATKDSNEIFVRGSNFYWIPASTPTGSGSVDDVVITLDLDREIYIHGIRYRIINIEHVGPNSDPLLGQDWKITLERAFEENTNSNLTHAIGAKFVGDPFYFELPTDLVWLGDMEKDGRPNKCLPCSYPIECA